ncbi:hypothetical protein ONZ45_g17718 [Pleurotus djamor]|nr:hypothetical protein ONZ45_g17718 [Pleurotus djamor]
MSNIPINEYLKVIDPELLTNGEKAEREALLKTPLPSLPRFPQPTPSTEYQTRESSISEHEELRKRWDQGPSGDPFAPPPLPYFIYVDAVEPAFIDPRGGSIQRPPTPDQLYAPVYVVDVLPSEAAIVSHGHPLPLFNADANRIDTPSASITDVRVPLVAAGSQQASMGIKEQEDKENASVAASSASIAPASSSPKHKRTSKNHKTVSVSNKRVTKTTKAASVSRLRRGPPIVCPDCNTSFRNSRNDSMHRHKEKACANKILRQAMKSAPKKKRAQKRGRGVH